MLGMASSRGRAEALHTIDLCLRKQPAAATPGPEAAKAEGGPGPSPNRPAPGRDGKRPTYLFKPLERELDEAIFEAFQAGSVERALGVVARGADVNFQRKNADDTTVLMAAAYVGDVRAVARLLRAGANPCLVDRNGATASTLARERGHSACEILLSQAASDVAGPGPDDSQADYVFDVYALEVGGRPPAEAEAEAGGPVVQVQGLGFVEGGAGAGAEGELVFEEDSDWSECGDEEPDSNDEDYYANDYPEQPSSEDDEAGLACGAGEKSSSEAGSDYDDDMVRDQGFRITAATRRHLMENIRRRSEGVGSFLSSFAGGRHCGGGDSSSADEDDLDPFEPDQAAAGIGAPALAGLRRFAYDSDLDDVMHGDDDDDDDDDDD
jgi:hypothetical protein